MDMLQLIERRMDFMDQHIEERVLDNFKKRLGTIEEIEAFSSHQITNIYNSFQGGEGAQS